MTPGQNRFEALDRAECAIKGAGLGPEQVAWRVRVLPVLQILKLICRELGSIPAPAMIFETRHTLRSLITTLPHPLHYTLYIINIILT
jgi:hypothetical protein